MKAKTFLLQVRKLNAMIENKRDEKAQLYLLATNTTSGAAPDTGVRVQSSGNQQRMASTIESIVDIGREIESMIRFLHAVKQQILDVIEGLETDEYNVLHAVFIGKVQKDPRSGREYMDYPSLKECADTFGKSESWVRSKYDRGLSMVQNIIDREKIEPMDAQIKRWKKEKSGKM